MSLIHRFSLSVGLSLLVLIQAPLPASEMPGEIVATVNGQPIRAEQIQLQFFLDSVPADAGEEARRKLVRELIDRELIRQFLKTRQVSADQARLDHQLEVIQQMIAKQGEQLDDVLGRLHLTSESLKQVLALPLAWDAYVQSVVTDKQLSDLWAARRPELDGTRVQASQIVRILPSNATEPEWQAAEKLLGDLRGKIVEGKLTFAQAAESESQSPSGKNGGDLGEFEFRGRVDDAISRVAFATSPGEVSQAFRSRFGVHLVQTRKVIPGQLSQEDARQDLLSLLSRQLWDEKVKELRKQAKVQEGGKK